MEERRRGEVREEKLEKKSLRGRRSLRGEKKEKFERRGRRRGKEGYLLGEVVGEEVPELEVDPGDGEHGAVDEVGVAGEPRQHGRHVPRDHRVHVAIHGPPGAR